MSQCDVEWKLRGWDSEYGKIQTTYRNVPGTKGRGEGKKEHIKKVSSEDYSSSPGKMQARSGKSCEAGSGVNVCEENELERLIEAVLQKPMTLDLIFKVLES